MDSEKWSRVVLKGIIAALLLVVSLLCRAQGEFFFDNPSAPTRIGSSNGPLAARGIWAQMFAGLTLDSLTPVDVAVAHRTNGFVTGGIIAVPSIPPGTLGYIQMVAWDGTRWGTSLSGVPADQLGRTDVVRQYFSYSFQPSFSPSFTQPAIVPVPEPSTFALGAIGACALWLVWRTRPVKFGGGSR